MKNGWWFRKWDRPRLNLDFWQYLMAEFFATTFYMIGMMNLGFEALSIPTQAIGIAAFSITVSFSFALRFQTYYNPTVVFGLIIGSSMNIWLGLSLMVVEFLAAFVAGGLFLVIHPDVHGIDGRRIIFHPGIGVSDLTAIFTELIASAILVMTALRYCEDDVECFDDTACAYIRQNLILRNAFRSIALGFTRGYLFLPAKFTSLAAYNTAEVLSVCVISQQCSKIWIYFIGDFGGALLAGLFNYIFLFG